ncbi:MAG TPA: PEP-CTERM sorting domain-containing protein [Edaphobacter sp.]|nr:PEP-CTERM sorting domain-containing protein [Edaphobacter sp.]
MKIKLFVVALLASAFAFAPLAKADSISFVSHVGNDYTYDLTLDHNLTLFIPGGFTLSGLSGVTAVKLTGELDRLFDVVYHDATTVTVGTLFNASYDFGKLPYDIGTLTLTSLASPGLTDFSIYDSHGIFCGNVNGPGSDPSPVPEPSSLILLGTGLLAAAGATRRKLFA